MSKSSARGSLIGLKSNLPAMPKVPPVALTEEMEERILGSDTITPSPAPRLPPIAGGRKKEPAVLMNAKLPERLHARLKRTAQFNDISMTEILIRAIETELDTGRYTAPPDTWGSEV